MPRGYQQLGSVLLVRLPDELRPYFSVIGESWQEVLGARTVLRPRGPVEGDWRLPSVDVIAGDETETEVLEHGIRYRFDAQRVLFSRGNKIERALAGRLVRPGETVIDLFAGIGYFALPAAVHGQAQKVIACEANPVAFRYLTENARRNRVDHIIHPVAGDNRTVPLPQGTADRIFLGYLPSSLPWNSGERSRCFGTRAERCTCIFSRTCGAAGSARSTPSALRSSGAEVGSLASRPER